MKKIFLLSALASLMGAQAALAQEPAEVTYVEDASQGLLINKMKDNWFITVEGGVNKGLTGFNKHSYFWKNVKPAAGIYVGKWFTPVFGARVGVNMLFTQSLSNEVPYPSDNTMQNGYYRVKHNEIGPVGDLLVNLTNWIGGYKPKRVWNLTAYVGAGGYFSLVPKYENGKRDGWQNEDDNVLTFHGGIMNTFRLCDALDLGIDFRWSFYDAHNSTFWTRPNEEGLNRTSGNLQAYVNLTYKFKKRDWNGPMVPVCPPVQDCGPYIAALDDANAKIAELETQLRACLDRPAPAPVAAEEHLATIYYPINVSKLSKEDVAVVGAIAEVMNSNPKQRYLVTGWADNYTGNDEINTRLRHARANGVKDALVRSGVNPDQLDVTINAGNLCDLGEKCVSLDRAVTIDEIK